MKRNLSKVCGEGPNSVAFRNVAAPARASGRIPAVVRPNLLGALVLRLVYFGGVARIRIANPISGARA